MAPRTKPTDLPKAAKEYKDMLEALGGVNTTTIKTCDSKMRNKAITAMKAQMHDDKSDEYKALASDSDRHDFIVHYLMDPQSITCQGTNFASRTSTGSDSSVVLWLTEDELAGPAYLNSTTNAKLAITAMQARPHSNLGMRNAGIMEYKHVMKKKRTRNPFRRVRRLRRRRAWWQVIS